MLEAINRAQYLVEQAVYLARNISKAIVLNRSEATEAIRKAVAGLESVAGLKADSAYVGISGQHIKAFNNQAMIAITRCDHLVTSRAIKLQGKR